METKNKRTLVIASLIVVVTAGTAAFFWVKGAAYETTDNAQVDGDIVPVRSSITAYVDSIFFKDNQRVKQGDTLLVFNTKTLDAKVAQAEAALENARAGLSVSDIRALASQENAQASQQQAKSTGENIRIAQADEEKAEKDLQRIKALLQIKAATQEQYENALNHLQVAKAGYDQAVSQQNSSLSTSAGLNTSAQAEKSQVSVAQALVKQRAAELALAQEEQHHAYIIAPFDGIVSKRTVEQGQYVSAGQTLMAIIDTRHVWVAANFKETQLNRLQPGLPVEITVDAYPGLKWSGKIDSYPGATGSRFSLLPPDNATGNFIKITQRFPVRISIDNAQPATLYPGLSVFLKVKTN